MPERLEARYPAALETQENGALRARFVDLEDTFTEGATLDEALFNGAEVLSAMLGWMLDENKPIPDPSPASDGLYMIAPDARTQAALLIRRARGERSLAELARSVRYFSSLARSASSATLRSVMSIATRRHSASSPSRAPTPSRRR